jgi:hypothetical protein
MSLWLGIPVALVAVGTIFNSGLKMIRRIRGNRQRKAILAAKRPARLYVAPWSPPRFPR